MDSIEDYGRLTNIDRFLMRLLVHYDVNTNKNQ